MSVRRVITIDNTYVLFHSKKPPEPRDKVPPGEVVVRPARRQYEGEDVALSRSVESVADYRDDALLRPRHCLLVRVDNTVLVVQYLREHDERVSVARRLPEVILPVVF